MILKIISRSKLLFSFSGQCAIMGCKVIQTLDYSIFQYYTLHFYTIINMLILLKQIWISEFWMKVHILNKKPEEKLQPSNFMKKINRKLSFENCDANAFNIYLIPTKISGTTFGCRNKQIKLCRKLMCIFFGQCREKLFGTTIFS